MSYKFSMKKIIGSLPRQNEFVLSSPEKISLKKKCAFSLPAGPAFSCSGATEACKDCYAQKHRHVFPNVQLSLAKNWKRVKYLERYNKQNDFVKNLIESIPKDAEFFRIHESGDWFSQWYIDAWNKVISEKSNVNFWSYTRVFDLDYSTILKNKNFILWASTDEYNIKEAKQFVKKYKIKYAFGPYAHNIALPKNSIVCAATNKKIPMSGACQKCKLCFNKSNKKNIVFLKH